MRVKAAVCREQQAKQLEIAANDPLESRRKIAEAAAKAWGLEAIQADKRESGHIDADDKLNAEITREFADEAKAETAAKKEKHAH